MINLDELTDEQLAHLEEQFKKLNSVMGTLHDASKTQKTEPENKTYTGARLWLRLLSGKAASVSDWCTYR